MAKTVELTDKFYSYWQKRVVKGEVSGFDNLEARAVSIFAEWLVENYDVGPKQPISDRVVAVSTRLAEDERVAKEKVKRAREAGDA